jgi:hypothetical protein
MMADLSKLRKKIKPVVVAAGGSAILVAGFIGGCSTGTISGNLIAPDVVEQDWTSGNLIVPDVWGFDEGLKDEGTIEPDVFISGNLIPPDVQEWDEGSATDEGTAVDEGSATDEGTAVDEGTSKDEGEVEPDFFISGNLIPPDVTAFPSKDVDDSKGDADETPAIPVPGDDE